MVVTYDPNKSERNRQERGFSFGYASRVFDRAVEITFARVEDGEVRLKAVGEIDGTLFTVIFTDQDDVRRIISARTASRKERREWNPE